MTPNQQPVLHRKGHQFRDDGRALTSMPEADAAAKKSKTKMGAEEPDHEIQPVEIERKRLQFLKHNNPVQFRELAEQTLIKIVRYMVSKNGGRPVDFFAVQQEGSYKIGVSLETVKRYVFTHSASSAELRLTGKKVGINPDFVPDEDPEEELPNDQ